MILSNVEIDNYKSIKERTSIDVPSDISLLIGNNKDSIGMDSNESGKTNFSESMFWAITGTPPDNSNADEVIKHGEDYCRVKLTFQDKNNKVQIERKRTKSSGSNKLYFYLNGELQNQETTVPSKVQETINKYFGIKGTRGQILKDLMITNLLTYDSVENFAKSNKDKERFNFISRIFNLEKWDASRELANKQKKKIQKNLDSLKAKNSVYKDDVKNINMPQLLEDIDNAMNNAEKLKELKKAKEKEKQELISLKEKAQEKENIKNKINKYKTRLKEEKNIKKVSIKKEEKYIRGTKKSIKDLKEKNQEKPKEFKDELKNKINTLEEKLENKKDELEKTKNKISKLKHKDLSNIKTQISSQKNTVQSALECPYCQNHLMIENSNLEKFNKEKLQQSIEKNKEKKEKIEHTIEALTSTKNTQLEQKSSISNKISKYNRLIEDISQAEQRDTLIQEKTKDVRLAKERIKETKSNYKKVKKQLKEDLEEWKEKLEEIDTDINYKKIKNNIATKKKEIDKIETDIQNTIELKTKKEQQIKSYKKSKNKIKELKSKLKKEKKKHEAFEFWYNNFPEIKRMIIQSTLPNIEQLTNKYLKEMQVPLSIQLSTLDETQTTGNKKQAFSIKVYDHTQDKLDNFYSRSLGGRKRIGLALCFALQEIKSSNLPNWFEFKVLDEVLENLDETGQDNIFDLMNKKGQYIITSHNYNLKDKFKNVIMVTKENGSSSVKNISK